MDKQVNGIRNFWWIPFGGILIAGLILGFFFDLSTAERMFAPGNLFGVAIDYAGSVPAYALAGFAGPLLYIAGRRSSKTWAKYLGFAAFFIIPLGSGLVLGFDVFYDRFKYFGLLGAAAFILGLDALLFIIFRHGRRKEAAKDAIMLLISFGVTFIITFVLKQLIERPRYIYVFDHPEAFRPLFDFSSNLKGVDKELLNSFPSGHSSLAASVLLFPILCKHSDKTKDHENGLFAIVCLYIVVIMLGRMISGHHFLSDVCFGALIGTVVSFLTVFLSQFVNFNKKDEMKNG